MKRSLFAVLMILGLLVFGMVAMAQDTDEAPMDMSEDAVFVMIQGAESGTFTEDEDGNVLLTLVGVDRSVTMIQSVPTLSTSSWLPDQLATTWSNLEDELIVEDALLEYSEGAVVISLTGATFDPATDTMTYTVQIGELLADDTDAEKGLGAPAEFEGGTLYARIDMDFYNTLGLPLDGFRGFIAGGSGAG